MIHEFSTHDRSQAWFKRLHGSLIIRLQKLREKNDKSMDAIETATIRGQIAAIKDLLADMKEKPAPTVSEHRNPYR